jgi:hypothetical protein
MQIYVGKNGQQLGPFSLEEVNRKLADGTFAGTDLAWYEGATGWAPLSSVAGIVIPPSAAASAPAPAPVSAPRPAPIPVQPAAAPVRPNTPIVQPARSPVRTLVVVSWALIGVSFLLSLVPFVGCGAWAFAAPVAIAAIIMGIIMLTRGATGAGIMTILGGVLIVPLCLAGQFASLAVLGSFSDTPKKLQILTNLRSIDTAKNDFVIKTNPATGANVTMAALSSYLNGKEIKPIIGETYDPKPIGQPATATLPANKTLGKLKGGETFTAEQLQKDIDTTFTWKTTKTDLNSPNPAASPVSSARPTAAPSVSAAPSVTASPKPSVSPRPSSPPHSLISPRQTVEPQDSPSSRTSPSAKFAPRINPRRSPSPSQERSDSESSGAPRQGRKNPRDTPNTSPAPSPDDDDE